MRRMKKLVGLLVAMVMVLSMTLTTLAAGTHTITLPAGDDHSYAVYQIFTGDLDLAEEKLSNVKWGENSTGTVGESVDDATLEALAAVNGATTDSAKLAVITNYVDLESEPIATLTSTHREAQVAEGYYLIKDLGAVGANDTYTTYIVQLVDDITITRKADVPTVEKKVKDTCDTTGAITGWQDSADYHIGDVMPFQLKGVVADDFAEYEEYYFAFHDTEEKGLAFNEDSVVVFIDVNNNAELDDADIKLTENKDYVLVTNPTDGHTFDIIFDDLKDVEGVSGGTVIRVNYTSTLDTDAVLGSMGNVNKVYLEFSNNPNDNQGGKPTGTTPDDAVIIFTYKVVVNKYANEVKPGNELVGADFTLEMKVGNEWVPISKVETTAGSTFTFTGLDDGEYRLTESVVPDGYNEIDPIYFTVTAEHNVVWEGTERTDVLTSLTGNVASGEITFETSADLSTLTTNIVNKSGTVLPETGGMGTTLFYVFGTILVIGAAVVLVTKKRMSGIR